jgi:hypothetical protein
MFLSPSYPGISLEMWSKARISIAVCKLLGQARDVDNFSGSAPTRYLAFV